MNVLLIVHFILPFVVMMVILVHLLLLHNTGRTSPLFRHSGLIKIPFYPFFWVKDIMNLFFYMVFIITMLLFPYSLGEPELFEEANSLNSPVHITPEWYFLAAYAVLRSVPRKPVGVIIALLMFVVLYALSYFNTGYITPPSGLSSSLFYMSLTIWVTLGYVGSAPIERPYTLVGLFLTILFIMFHILLMLLGVMIQAVYSVGKHFY